MLESTVHAKPTTNYDFHVRAFSRASYDFHLSHAINVRVRNGKRLFM